ncbi:MAG: hypothetical protein C0603_03085 [Denitrovibrio sp.]|nr:MAG: hypothetical protein C0603_03085 [Denitrovibrio sp.]
MDVRNKAILIILIVTMLMASVFVSIAISEHQQIYNEKITHHENSLSYLVNSEFLDLKQVYTARLKGFIKSNTQVISAFAERDRPLLIKKLQHRFNTFNNENNDFFDIVFTTPEGTLFLSMDDKNSYGNNYTHYNYVKSLQNNSSSIHGFTISNGQLFFQVASNIYLENKNIGSIEFKIKTSRMNEMIMELLDADYGVAVTHKINSDTSLNNTYDTTIVDANCPLFTNLPNDFNFESKIQKVKLDDKSYLIHYKKILNFDNTLVGYYLTSNDITEMEKSFNSFIIYILLATAVIIILSSLVLYKGFGVVLKQIENINLNLEEKINKRTKELNIAKDNAVEQNKIINTLYERFKSMFDNHHSIMFLIDTADGSVVDANSAACHFTKLDKETLQKLSVADFSLIPHEDILQILEKSKPNGLKNYRTKFAIDNTILDIEIQATQLDFDDKTLLFAICYDVTEKIKFENELKELNKNLELKIEKEVKKQKQQEMLLIQQSKMSSVGEILSAIIHQWKQPMTAISYLMQDLADSPEHNIKNTEHIEHISKEALEQINYMNKTVDDFRKFLMPTNSKEIFNIVESVSSTINMVIKQIIKDEMDLNITIINDNQEAQSFDIATITEGNSFGINIDCFNTKGYPNEFKQVLMNIIYNARDAIKANRKDDLTTGKLNIMVSCKNNHIELGVGDNAGGIPDEIINKVFEPYFTTKSQQGTGIGLYMAKSIIENHMEGKITAHNSDIGAVFTINLKQYRVG